MTRPPARAFSVTELLVVVAIIGLLVAVLLPVLGTVRRRANAAKTESTMQGFATACATYRETFGFSPGVVPEATLADDPEIAGTENALLALLGGSVRRDDVGQSAFEARYPASEGWVLVTFGGEGMTPGDYRIKINRGRIGEGPVVDGRDHPPFARLDADELALMRGEQIVSPSNGPEPLRVPDLLDAWGQPILYLRRLHASGPLVGSPDGPVQFARGPITPYVHSTRLGVLGRSQLDAGDGSPFSLLNAGDTGQQHATLAQVIRHPAYGDPDNPREGTARGDIILISAGPDGIYFSTHDGPGSPSEPLEVIADPDDVDRFDDIVLSGG
jgi:type II secretory pathway pseudopilin PulG